MWFLRRRRLRRNGPVAGADQQPILFQTCSRSDRRPEPESSRMGRLLPFWLSVACVPGSRLLRAAAFADSSHGGASAATARPKASAFMRIFGGLVSMPFVASFWSIVYMRAGCGKSARPVRQGGNYIVPYSTVIFLNVAATPPVPGGAMNRPCLKSAVRVLLPGHHFAPTRSFDASAHSVITVK